MKHLIVPFKCQPDRLCLHHQHGTGASGDGRATAGAGRRTS